MTSDSPDPSRPPSPSTRGPSPPPQTHPAPDAPRLMPSAVLGPHSLLPPSTALIRHKGNILPARPPDFVSAAIRTPAHFEALTKGLRDYDFHVEMSKFAYQTGMEFQPSARRASVATILETMSRGSPGRVTVFHANPSIGSGDRSEGDDDAAKEGQKIEVIDSTEEDEEEKTVVVKKKKKKSKKKAKGKKAEMGSGTVSTPQQEKINPITEGNELAGTTMMEKTTLQLIAAEKGGQAGSEAMSDDETVKEVSRPASADGIDEDAVKDQLPSQSQTLIVETAPRPYLIPPHLRGATTPASLLLTDLDNSNAITVNLPSARTVSSPAAIFTLPVVLEELADEDLKVVAEMTGSTASPDVMTPAVLGDGAIPDISISTPLLDRIGASPTPTETDEDVKTPGDSVKIDTLKTTDTTPRLAPLGFGATDGITPLSTILPKTQSTADEITSADQLIQLTTFSPRGDISSSPVTDDPLSVLAEAAINSATTATPPAAPYLSPQLPVDIPSPLAGGPHQRFFSPPPSSPLRHHILPGTPEPLHPTTNAWSLFYSSNASAETRANPGRTSAKAYNENLIHLFTSAELAELFGLWKALRRQIALDTGRTIEAEGEELAPGQIGLGLQYMKDDGNFHFFVKGVKPMWEDPMCAKGGKIMFAGPKDQMDSLFFDVVLLLISDRLSLLCPPPLGSGSFIVGTCISRRPTVTRIEIWLGGPQAPSCEWTKTVQDVFVKELGEEKVYEYKSFASWSGRRTATGELAAPGRGMNGSGILSGPNTPLTMSPIPSPAGLGRGMGMQPGAGNIGGWAMNVPMGRELPMGRSMSTGIITTGGRGPR